MLMCEVQPFKSNNCHIHFLHCHYLKSITVGLTSLTPCTFNNCPKWLRSPLDCASR
jgi:hypothetical protein